MGAFDEFRQLKKPVERCFGLGAHLGPRVYLSPIQQEAEVIDQPALRVGSAAL